MVDEQFEGDRLDDERWIPHYLPQWRGRERSKARYRVLDGRLELTIEPDQEPWYPEVTGPMRVSSLQTGCFAGPLGSTIGQHRTDERMWVVEEQPTRRLVTPDRGVVEMRAAWAPHADAMVALWMIGFEDVPERSAEICVCEIFGSEVVDGRALIGMGVRPFGDPRLTDEFAKVAVDIHVDDWHSYATCWDGSTVTFWIDDEHVFEVGQSPTYPMQLMLNIYAFAEPSEAEEIPPFRVDRIRVWEPFEKDRQA